MNHLSEDPAKYQGGDCGQCHSDNGVDGGVRSSGVALVLCAEAGLHTEPRHLLFVAVFQHRGAVILLDTCKHVRLYFETFNLRRNILTSSAKHGNVFDEVVLVPVGVNVLDAGVAVGQWAVGVGIVGKV